MDVTGSRPRADGRTLYVLMAVTTRQMRQDASTMTEITLTKTIRDMQYGVRHLTLL